MTPQKNKKSGSLDNLPKSSLFDKMASFFVHLFGPRVFFGTHGARDHMKGPDVFPFGHRNSDASFGINAFRCYDECWSSGPLVFL